MQDGPFVAFTDEERREAENDPHRYERFFGPLAWAAQGLKRMVQSPFDMARDARQAGGYSQLDPREVGREGLNTGLGTLMPGVATAAGQVPKGADLMLSAGGAREMDYAAGAPATRTTPGRLFDTSPDRLKGVPDVPQLPFTEPEFARGLPDHVKNQKLSGKKNMDRLRGYIAEGDKMGGRGWYNNDQLKDAFIAELGQEQGTDAFRRLMDFTSATSAQSKVGENVRNASFRYANAAQGGAPPAKDFKPPSPYGHYAQQLHNQQVAQIMQGQLDPIRNPKVFRFGENLKGNQTPVTIDSHATRAIGLRTKGGEPTDLPDKAYSHLGDIMRRLAKERDMTPAQAQASMWIGAGDETGLLSARDPFLKVFEDRIAHTAAQRGLSKEEVLRRMIRGEEPLLSVAPAPASPFSEDRQQAEPVQ